MLPTDDDAGRLRRTMDRFAARCVWHVVNTEPLRHLPTTTIFPLSTYYRFVAGDYFYGKAKRILYLDADIQCLKSLRPLYDMALPPGKGLAAYREPVPRYRLERIGLEGECYLNSGVLLIDVDAWREYEISGRALRMLAAGTTRYYYPDQDVLNLLFQGRVEWLPKAYNRNDNRDGEIYEPDTVIIHYLASPKPWMLCYYTTGPGLYRQCWMRSEWRDADFRIPPRTVHETRLTGRACWRRGEYLDALKWYAKYVRWKFLRIRP